ncbi:Desiccation-related protein PCC13-62 [Glycine soja]|uniref:Desiccation-related protein PCC13-62 n=1 Tax=Glycine soja TaxID=3848 RepID=A0A0B2PNG8_GLYSO|nr:Desiccation-related protein PCC13-62 [Glycine soja]
MLIRSTNYQLASYVIPYVGLTGYVGANPLLQNATSKKARFTLMK